jgi:hypothetical protein
MSLKPFFFLIIPLLTSACGGMKEGKDLSAGELKYLEEIGLLDPDEDVLLFDSQTTFEESGNFCTNKRLATYWLSDRPKDNQIRFAYHWFIDSIQMVHRNRYFSDAAYLKIYKKDSTEFKVYIDEDSAMAQEFYNEATVAWENAVESCSSYTETFGQLEQLTSNQNDSIFQTPIALLFSANLNWVYEFDQPGLEDSLPSHFDERRQQIYNTLTNSGLTGAVKAVLEGMKVPLIKAHYSEKHATFLVNDNRFTVSLAQFEQFDGIILYYPSKKPVFINYFNSPGRFSIKKAVAAYYHPN